ncbi:restriction endonuclease subunit S [Ferrovibrio sp.]|uniref:restriction endonuclease subunit S n=1 Tax=Ferrovibrio sp. TaxID=1917215 RepID=UPI002611151B|nr:restriction endonuclease subunit S [Ferrovibrio sp.]
MKAGWQVRPLGEILEKTETVNPLQSPEEEFDYIDVSSISNRNFRIEAVQRLQGKNAPSRARRLVRTNDILFATIRPTLQRIAIVPVELNKQVCSTGYVILRPKPELNYRFLFYYLFTEEFMGQMESLQKGASYPAVTDGEIYSQPIAYPPLSEQQRIARTLDKALGEVSTVKSNTEKNIQNAIDLFDQYLQEVFARRGDDWDEKRLSEVSVDFGRGKSKHRPRNDPALYGGKYPFIQTGDVRNSDHLITTFSQTYNDLGLAQSKLWPKGTLCITIAANIAETGILGFEACFPDSVIGVVVDAKQTSTKYLEYLLQSFKVHLQAQGKGSAQANINLATFEGQRFPFPSLKVQSEIVATLDSLRENIRHLESLYQRKLAALDELKKSLLRQAFSGNL